MAIIVLLGVSILPGCTSSIKNNEVELTIDNIDQYIDIAAKSYQSGDRYYDTDRYYSNSYKFGYSRITSSVEVTPTSSMLLFKNASITIGISGSYYGTGEGYNYRNFTRKDYNEIIDVQISLGGTGSNSKTKFVGNYDVVSKDNGYYYAYDYSCYGYSIISVSGTVEIVK